MNIFLIFAIQRQVCVCIYIFGYIKMGISRTLSCSWEMCFYVWSIGSEVYLCEVSHY